MLPMSFLSCKTPLSPSTLISPMDKSALSVSGVVADAVDAVDRVGVGLAPILVAVGFTLCGGSVIVKSTESLWLPKMLPVSGTVAVTERVEPVGCTCTEILPNSLFASSLLAALTFFRVVMVVVVALGSTVIVILPI